jgi:alpha-ribazole phosphatase/probable phosphoglycerate mutase
MSEPFRWPSGRRLFLMRHGETYEPHPDTRVPSRDENPRLPLTPRGRERLGEVARWMAQLPIEAAYASPYRRAQDTARIVTEPHAIEIRTLDSIKELEVHPPEGGTMGDVARRYLALIRELSEKGEHEVRLDCGRSLGEIVDAALAEIRDTLERAQGSVLVVAHGGLNRFLLGRWLGMPAVRAIALEQNFACVNLIEFIGSGHPWVRAVNATFHDPLKVDAPGL